MKRMQLTLCSILLAFSLTACGAGDAQSPTSAPSIAHSPITPAPSTQDTAQPKPTPPVSINNPDDLVEATVRNIQVAVGDTTFSATLEENEASIAFARLLQSAPLTISMRDYSGFEKVGSLGSSLPESDHSMTAQAGDIVLYNGNQVCVFYDSHSWSYTKLGTINDLSGWEEALGGGDVTLAFSIL